MGFVATKNIHPNVAAFLLAIQYAEGTYKYSNPYKILFGGGTFESFEDHPRIPFKTKWGNTSAAGAYQFMAKIPGFTKLDTWGELKQKLKLKDFSPESQDAAAIELIRRNGALNDIINGDFSNGFKKVSKVWASLPGAGYGQPEKSLTKLLVFINTVALPQVQVQNLVSKVSDLDKKKR